MFTSNSYLAPDTGQRRNKDTIAELWKAESYMDSRKIKGDKERIAWFIRGSSNQVIRWFMDNEEKILTWNDLEREYIINFGTNENRRVFIQRAKQGDMSVGEFTQKQLEVLASMKFIRGNIDLYRIIVGLNDKNLRSKIFDKIRIRPKNMPYVVWFKEVVRRLIRKENARSEKKERNSTEVSVEHVKNHVNWDKKTSTKESVEHAKNRVTVKYNMKELAMNKKEANMVEQAKDMSVSEKEETERKYVEELKRKFPYATNCEIKYREPCRLGICEIKTVLEKRICVKGKRRFEQSIIERTKETLEKLRRSKIIRESGSDWRSPITPVEKPDKSIRICTNLIALNNIVEKEEYPTPIMNDLIEKVQGSEYFTVVDLKDGYFQIEIREEDKKKTAFKFDNQVYEWNRMPMGFKNAPSIFQKMMDKLLGDLSNKGVEVYLDDIIVHSKTREEHDKLVDEVFRRLEANNLYINVEKLQLARREVMLLGLKVNGKTQRVTEESRNDILEYPRPTDVKGLRRFLGKMNFYGPFIKDMSRIAIPLYQKTGKYAKFEWTEEMEKSFVRLKECLNGEVRTYLPNYEKIFILETDASDTGLGASLLQLNEKGDMVPIRWASRKLTKAEMNYGITEKEFLAVVWGIEYFDYQLRGRKFKLITDHIALESIRNKGDFGNKRMNRWIERIQDYDFDITYKKGEELVSADALSRLYENEKIKEEDEGDENEKKKVIRSIHEQLLHRGLASVEYELTRYHKWPDARRLIKEVIESCEICSVNNRKLGGGCDFVETTAPLEIIAIDLMKVGEEDKSILVCIDYYTRKLELRVLKNRTTDEIIDNLANIFEKIGVPRVLNSDNAKEFVSKEFLNFCTDFEIEHHLTSVEKHSSNGRVERVIRTIREAMVKMKGLELGLLKTIKVIQDVYNETFHQGIGMTPEEAWNKKESEKLKYANQKGGEYAKGFKTRRRESFNTGQQVRIASKENLEVKGKSYDRFQERGIIIKTAGKDSYIVKSETGKMYKISHSDLKGIEMCKSLP
jgi:hypothetical protein